VKNVVILENGTKSESRFRLPFEFVTKILQHLILHESREYP